MRFLSTLLFFAAACGLHAQSVTGTWASHRTAPDGNVQDTFFDLKQNGNELTGSVIYAWGVLPVREGKVEGKRVSFVLEFGDAAAPRRTPWEGTIEGSELHLKSTPPGRPATELTAARVDPSVIASPKKEPLPALHDIPWNKLARTPPMGWNSWNKFQGKIDDKAVREIADAMVRTRMIDAGYVYINIDDTWQGQRDAQGKIHPNKKFPDMKALADYVHNKGLLIGIYSSPGPKTCAGYEGSLGHEEQDAETYDEWGIDYLKYDWCSAGRMYTEADMQAAYQKMGAALDKTARPIVFSLCQYGKADVWKWGPKVGGNLWRTTDDIQDNWASMSGIGFRQGELAAYAAPGHWNDPDMLEVGDGGMTDDEYRTHMSLWAMLAAPLLAGNDLRSMPANTLEILANKEVIQIDQDPLGKAATRKFKDGDQEVWTRPLAKGGMAVALFNRGAAPVPITVKWSDLLPGGITARDLWKHEFIKRESEKWTTTVPKHGVVLLRLSPIGATAARPPVR